MLFVEDMTAVKACCTLKVPFQRLFTVALGEGKLYLEQTFSEVYMTVA